VRDHEALDDWLRDHRDAADILTANPRAYTARPAYSADPDAGYGAPIASDLRSFEQYLDRNWEVADALYQEPELVNDRRFVRTHPSLDDWLQAHPAAARDPGPTPGVSVAGTDPGAERVLAPVPHPSLGA